MNANERYSRQIQTFDLQEDAQSRLAQSEVTLVGAGGLGFAVAAQLAGAGIGRLSIIDFDRVSLSNLHRQWLYTESNIGQPKVKVLHEHLLKLNSEISYHPYQAKLAPDNIDKLIPKSDLIIDAADNHAVSYLLSNHAKKLGISLLGASVNRHYGYISFFNTNKSPGFNTVFPRVNMTETSCDLVGVSGPTVMTVAGIQAQAALDFLSQQQASIDGSILYIDLRSNRLDQIQYSKNDTPPLFNIEFISPTQIGDQDWVIDVRSPEENLNSPFPFNIDQLIHIADIELASESLPKNKRIVSVCQSGQRALIAAQKLIDLNSNPVAVILSSEY